MIIAKEHNASGNSLKFYLGIALLFILLSSFPDITYAGDNYLLIKPARCIALHQGQTCYQKLSISWQADAVETYCLYAPENKLPHLCWENLAQGKGVFEFEGSTTQKLILMRKRDAKPIADFTIQVAWVYDSSSRRESHWRIF